MTSRRRAILRSTALVAVLGVLGACSGDGDSATPTTASTSEPPPTIEAPIGDIPNTIEYFGDLRGTRVAIIGDSVSLEAAGPIRDSLEDYLLAHHAQLSAGVDDMRGLIERQIGTGADILVLQLGTADVRSYGPEQIRPWFEEVVTLVEDVPCVLWVNVKTEDVHGFYSENWEEEAETFNGWLDDADDELQNLRVVDWAEAASEHPDWFLEDGLHLTYAGQAGLAELVESAIDACEI